ncbi:MAG: YraN family protein [Deltaproteobacteria bacterium RBG_13_43_22]|nr:MAG: YraN family protein [Deltaproteobacteria bacterium RBG_13_43_22]
MKPQKPAENPRGRVGRKGEDLAFELLKKRGYKVLERNFKSPLGEIDIIAREGRSLAFVEVKTRLSSNFGTAKWAVGPRKQRKLSMVALDYLKRHSLLEQPARFDVVAIDLDQGQAKVELIRNAFDLAY